MAREQYQRLTEPMFYLLLTVIEENHGYAMMQDIRSPKLEMARCIICWIVL